MATSAIPTVLPAREAADKIRIACHKRKLVALAELCADSEGGEHGINLDLGGLTEAC